MWLSLTTMYCTYGFAFWAKLPGVTSPHSTIPLPPSGNVQTPIITAWGCSCTMSSLHISALPFDIALVISALPWAQACTLHKALCEPACADLHHCSVCCAEWEPVHTSHKQHGAAANGFSTPEGKLATKAPSLAPAGEAASPSVIPSIQPFNMFAAQVCFSFLGMMM